MNPLEQLLQILAAEAGPRGSTFAGRVIPQGQQPDLRTLMTQQPSESPDAEGYAAAGTLIPMAAARARLRPSPKLPSKSSYPGMIPSDAVVEGGRAYRWGGPNKSIITDEWIQMRDGSWVKVP